MIEYVWEWGVTGMACELKTQQKSLSLSYHPSVSKLYSLKKNQIKIQKIIEV